MRRSPSVREAYCSPYAGRGTLEASERTRAPFHSSRTPAFGGRVSRDRGIFAGQRPAMYSSPFGCFQLRRDDERGEEPEGREDADRAARLFSARLAQLL